MQNPFEVEGNWYKANLHSHTTNSDGEYTLDEIKTVYKNDGFKILAITDHWKVSDVDRLNDANFLVIKGAELDVGKTELGSNFHIVALGIEQENVPQKDSSGNISINGVLTKVRDIPAEEIRKKIIDAGGLCFVAHPYWSVFTSTDLNQIGNFLGMEIINHGCELEIGKGISAVHWDEILMKGKKLFCFAVDDVHHKWNGIGGYNMIKMKELTKEALFDALKNGCFYSSMGPEIYDLRIVGEASASNKIILKCSPCKIINFMGNHQEGLGFQANREGKAITSAEYILKGKEKYIRVEIIDFDGRRAWSQPFFF